jgi:hypothetical protein
MMTPEQINVTAANAVGVLFAPGDSTQVQFKLADESNRDNGFGGRRPQATPGDGLGSAGSVTWRSGSRWTCLLGVLLALAL